MNKKGTSFFLRFFLLGYQGTKFCLILLAYKQNRIKITASLTSDPDPSLQGCHLGKTKENQPLPKEKK